MRIPIVNKIQTMAMHMCRNYERLGVRELFDIFERIIPSTRPRARFHTGCDIRATYIDISGSVRGMKEEGGRRSNDKSGSPNKYSESRLGRACGICVRARALAELFSRAPNRTLICDSDCHKLKGMPTFSPSPSTRPTRFN